jgi:hypothetical protein
MILYRTKDRDLISVFCMCIFSVPSNICNTCWIDCLYSKVYFWYFWWESDDCSCMGSFLVPFVCVPVFVPVAFCLWFYDTKV